MSAASADKQQEEEEEEMQEQQQQQQQQQQHADDRCGACGWAPDCLQPLRKFSLLFCCLVTATLACSVLGTYHNAMVSTFEKRFDWKTRTVGFILSANDYGYLTTVLFTAHFGGMSHRPRLIAVCTTLYGITAIVYFLPYLLYGPKFSSEVVFRPTLNSSSSSSSSSSVPFCEAAPPTPAATASAATESEAAFGEELQSTVAFIIFMFGGVLQGVAVGPFWNVAFALIDDMTKQWSGVFIGIYTLMRSVGPVLGYQLGSKTTKLNEGLGGTLGEFAGSQKSPLWIGAWWLGYLAIGVVVMCASLPLLLFPRDVPLETSADPEAVKNPLLRLLMQQSELKDDILQQEEQANPHSSSHDKSLAGLLRSMRRLFSNNIFICLLVGNLFEFTALNTPVNYSAKYFEHHFDLTQSEASSVTGWVMPIGFALGLTLSILVSYRFQMTMYSLARFHAFVHVFGVVRYLLGMLFTCETPTVLTSPLAAAAAATAAKQQYVVNGSYCGSCSDCTSRSYFPVCAGNLTFYSPCVAGCTDSLAVGCDCAPGGSVLRGTCEGACYSSLIAYALMSVVLMTVQSSARSQEAVINLRCVQPRDKALALASSSFLWGLVSSFLPPITGSVFDSICLINSSDGKRSYCEMYDRVQFRYAFHLVSVAAQTVACVMFFLVWYYSAKRYGRDGSGGVEGDVIDDGGTVELPMSSEPEAEPLKAVDAGNGNISD